MQAKVLFAKLWECATLGEALAVLGREPHRLYPIANRLNNKAPIRQNRDSIAAIMEGCTNGHDAVIRLAMEQGKFATPPHSVKEALDHLTGGRSRPQVHVLMQIAKGTKFEKAHCLTIADEGIGMDADGMLNGVLTFGSEDKVLDPLQFGSFGQGSASLFGHSQFSLIASRRAGTNTVVFTAVWLHRPAKEIHSYVYITRPDASLFEFDARELTPSATLQDSIYNTLRDNVPIIPQQGTIRRQLQMDGVSEYYSQRANSLYYALADRLFGVPAYIRMAADDQSSHSNTRRGRRWEFNSINVGECLPRSEWKLLEHVAPTNLAIHRRSQRIGLVQVETWVFSSYKTTGTGKSKSELHTPARHMMEGSERAAPRNVLVTLNGQTLDRLNSTALFTGAGLRPIAENIIIEVALDYLPDDILQDAELFLASRDRIFDWFERSLLDELKRYLESQESLERLAKEMMPPEDPNASPVEHFGLEINKVLTDPIFGPVIGYTPGRGDNAAEKAVGPKRDDRERKRQIELVEPPTLLELHKETVVKNATNWLSLHTNAKEERWGPRLELELPKFLTQMGPGRYSENGRMSIGVACDDSPLGTVGYVTVRLRGTKLEDRRKVMIVARNEGKRNIVVQPGGGKINGVAVQAPPTSRLIEVSGPDDLNWPSFFGAAGDTSEAAMNYAWDTHRNTIEVALHTQFPPLAKARRQLTDRYGQQIGLDFYRRVCQQTQINAMVFCRNQLLGETGAADAAHLSLLTDIARSIIVSVGRLYRTPSFRSSVLTGVPDAEA